MDENHFFRRFEAADQCLFSLYPACNMFARRQIDRFLMTGRYFCENLDAGYLQHWQCGRSQAVVTGVDRCEHTWTGGGFYDASEEDLFAYEQSACT